MNKILLIISDAKRRAEISKILVEGNYEVSSNAFADNPSELMKTFDPMLVMLDGHLMENVGAKLRQAYPQKPLVAWMSERDAKLAVDIINMGALDCLCPPVSFGEIHGVIRHILNKTVTKDAPVPLPKRDYRPLLQKIAIGVGLLSVIALFMLISGHQSSNSKTYPLTYQNPTGVFWYKNRLWTSDWYTQSVYQYKIGGSALKLLKIYSFPEYNANAVAVIKDMLWVSGTDGYIRTYSIVDNVPTIVNTFKAPGFSPTGLCLQGQYLWSTDAETNKIYQHSLNSPDDILATYDYPGAMPVGLFWDGKKFWSADGKANKVYRHSSPEAKFEIEASFALAPEGGGVVAGMSGDDNNLWLIYTSQPARVLRYPFTKLK